MRMGVVRQDRFAMCGRADGPGYLACNLIQKNPHPTFCMLDRQAVAATQHNTTHVHYKINRLVYTYKSNNVADTEM